MSIDLERSLAELARSVHDDGVAERMTGQVRHMVTRIRRRRAARYSATGVVGVGAAAGLAVGGLHLADRYPATVPPAATDLTPSPSMASVLRCGGSVPAPTDAGESGLSLALKLSDPAGDATYPADGDIPRVDVFVENASEDRVTVHQTEGAILAVVRDGVIVALAVPAEAGTATGDLPPGGAFETPASMALVLCNTDGPLADGEYQLVAAVTVEDVTHDRVVTLVGEPFPFTVSGASPEATTAEEALADTLAQAPVSDPFPHCGSAVPEQVDPPVVIDLVLGERVYAPGEVFTTEVTVRSTADRTVLANAPIPVARIVLTRDGIVVGQVIQEPVDTDLITVAPGAPLTVPAEAQLSVCRLGFVDYPPFDLPAGTYQAYAVAEMWLKEIQTPDDAYSLNELFAAMSDPVEITVG